MVSLFARVAISAVVLFVANSYHRVHFRESPRGKATHASQRLPSGLTHFHDTSQQPAHVCLDVSSNGKAVLLEDAETPEGDTIPKGTRVCGGTDHDHPFRHPKKIAPALVSTEDLDAKETVVLVHGFTDSLDTFNDMFEELDMAGYRVLRFDLLGHGASGEAADSEYAIPVFVSQLRDLIRARAVRKTHLIGMSMGAIIATEFAVAYPDLVSSLVLLVPAGVEVNVPASGLLVRLPVLGERRTTRTAPPETTTAQIVISNQTILRVLASYFAEPTEGDLVRGGFWRALDDGTVEKRVTRSVEWIRHSSSQRMILGVLRNIDLGDFDDRYEQLGSLGKRVLLLFAEGDRFIPMQAADKMKALVGDTAQLHLIPEARHLVHIERGDLVNGRILDFLKS